MLRILMATIAVVAFVLPAAAYDTYWDGAQDGNLDISLTLNCWVQVLWQDTAIEFDSDYDLPYNDWWCSQLMGAAYQPLPGPDGKVTAVDPWAGAGTPYYFESGDGAYMYVKSNNPLAMMVHTNGWLKATDPECPDCYIPTYFTMALSGPFLVGGQDIGLALIPGDGMGAYLNAVPQSNAGGTLDYTDAHFGIHPFQWAFDCDPASQEWLLGPVCPYVEGNIMFLARILRSGLEDPGGNYTTFLDVHFGAPDFSTP